MARQEFEQELFTPACSAENYFYKHPFSERWALQSINFSIEPGSLVAVFGDSGSGKTTLFSSITGLNHHFYKGGEHQGNLSLFGRNVAETDIFDLAKHYGLVTQDFRNQLLADRIEGAIAFPLENQAVSYKEMHGRVEELLKFLGLTDFRNRDVSSLSGGEGQAVVIASMLAKGPELMIFDDVASDLDQGGQARIREIFKGLKSKGITMFIVDSSSPQKLLEGADKVLILKEGKQIFLGAPERILLDGSLMEKIGAFVPQIEFREPKNSPVAISVENVCFGYNGNPAVTDVSCQITKDSITGIIGHNGSGKTTLAKIIAGLYKPNSGKITIKGINPFSLPAEKAVRLVSLLPQNTAGTFFTDTVKKELAFTPKAIKGKEVVTPEMIGLQGLENEHPEFLSAGQRERLALGCALSPNSDILIVDEPTKGLNQKERFELVNQLKLLQEQGKTIVLISHDWPLIARATNNLLVMDHGRLVAQGPTCKVLQDRDFFEELGLPLPW